MLESSLSFHIHYVAFHHHCIDKVGNSLRLGQNNTEGMGEEMERDTKRAGYGA